MLAWSLRWSFCLQMLRTRLRVLGGDDGMALMLYATHFRYAMQSAPTQEQHHRASLGEELRMATLYSDKRNPVQLTGVRVVTRYCCACRAIDRGWLCVAQYHNTSAQLDAQRVTQSSEGMSLVHSTALTRSLLGSHNVGHTIVLPCVRLLSPASHEAKKV